ncbi:NirD/YgiW/YdeI family stress tolerance protein [Parasalinivibrio latis]|uniref:YgiW/YdeI family stress tolerance OB fold protein n=1 Tax=Parasalinivibrio latis TaxID=2952610 RepID=UPI0030E4F7C2
MKKQTVLTIGALLLSTSAFAQSGTTQQTQTGGFYGPSSDIATVQDVLNAGLFSDDTPVTLIGHIKSGLGGERYMFADETGQIPVEIDQDKWHGQKITPTTKVKISGEIDRDIDNAAVDVDVVQVVPAK